MQPNNTRRKPTHHASLVLLATIAFSAAPCAHAAAVPEPLPPPPELLDGAGYSIDAQYPRQPGYSPAPQYADRQYPAQQNPAASGRYAPPPPARPSRPGDEPYDPYVTPASAYLPPLPGTVDSEVGEPYATRGNGYQAPPMANLPYDPNRGQFQVSPPASNLPDDYYTLPFLREEMIPGVLMPEFNEEFHDPGLDARPTRRPLRSGLSPRQLEPFFELAKGSEKAALDAKKANNDRRHLDELKRAVDAYMEIIAMADAGHEAREEAWYGVARCEYRRENWWRAFDALERSFPGEFEKNEVAGRIKLEMFIGERLWRLGHNPVPEAKKDGGTLSGYQAASRVYAAAIFNHPNSKDAPLALLRRGDAAAMEENWEEAAKFYRSVVQYYPDSEPAMQARSSLTEAVYRQQWPAGMPEVARNDLDRMMTEVETTERRLSPPAEERRQRAAFLANNEEAERRLNQAKDYMGKIRVKKSRDAAVFQLGQIVSLYPNTPQAHEAADLLRGMGIEPPMILAEGDRYPITGAGGDLEISRNAGSGRAVLERPRTAEPDYWQRHEQRQQGSAQGFSPAPGVPGAQGQATAQGHSPAPAPGSMPYTGQMYVPGLAPDFEREW